MTAKRDPGYPRPLLPFCRGWGDPCHSLKRYALPRHRLVPLDDLPHPDGRCGTFDCHRLCQIRSSRDNRQVAAAGAGLGVHAREQDLPQNRGGGCHLRTDAFGQNSRDRRQALLHRLPGEANVDVPVELHIDDGEPGCGLASHGLDSVGTEEGDLDGLGHERFHFLGGEAWALGDDHDPRAIEVGEHVDRHERGEVASVDEKHQARHDDEEAVLKGESDDAVEHDGCLMGTMFGAIGVDVDPHGGSTRGLGFQNTVE